jgi:hypothetical protein
MHGQLGTTVLLYSGLSADCSCSKIAEISADCYADHRLSSLEYSSSEKQNFSDKLVTSTCMAAAIAAAAPPPAQPQEKKGQHFRIANSSNNNAQAIARPPDITKMLVTGEGSPVTRSGVRIH